MKTRHITVAFLMTLILTSRYSAAQQKEAISLSKAIEMALQNNHLLNARKWQVAEKLAKVEEDRVKKYPVVNVSSSYQYNAALGALTIPQGSFGSLPLSSGTTVLLPDTEKKFDLGSHHTANAGVMVYQPITQLSKIKVGIDIAKTDVTIAEQERDKTILAIRQAVEKLYYGLLISAKQQTEAQAKLELARLKLYDVEGALLAGKTVDVSKVGLQASIADEEQNLLKLQIQEEDYTADLKLLTGSTATGFVLENVAVLPEVVASAEEYKLAAASQNPDIRVATLGELKTEQAIKAARLSYRPDVGAVAGYTYQVGNILFPTHSPYVGVNFKWNIQDIFSNKQVLMQRGALLQQAHENTAGVKEQINAEIDKAHRKIKQAGALVMVAQKAVNYRTEELRLQTDRLEAGQSLRADILTIRSLLARAEADLLAAQLNYNLARSELALLTGTLAQ